MFYNYSSSRDTWSSVSNNLPNVRITELEINPSLNKLYAATYGRGLWVADLEPLSLSSSRLNQFEFEVFPNPVESELTILTNKTFEAQIKIYDFQMSETRNEFSAEAACWTRFWGTRRPPSSRPGCSRRWATSCGGT